MAKAVTSIKKKERMENALKAMQELTPEERENLVDYLAMEEAKKTPSQPLEEYLAEWEEQHKKRTRM